MPASSESLERTWDLSPAEVLHLFQQIGHLIGIGHEPKETLQGAAESIGAVLPIDKCTFLLVSASGDSEEDDETSMAVVAETQSDSTNSIVGAHYLFSADHELLQMMQEGKPLPLMDIRTASSSPSVTSELDRFISETNSKSIMAFPMVAAEKLVGCMTMHLCREAQPFPEHVLELGETIAQELGVTVERCRAMHEREAESKVFRDTAAAALILERTSFRIRRVNAAGNKILAGSRKDLHGLPITQVVPEGQRLIAALKELSLEHSVVNVSGVLVGTVDGKPVHMDACLSLLNQDGRDDALILFTPSAQLLTDGGQATEQARLQRAEELANTLTRQLSWERWVRQIICKLHATLDRDTLLQTVVDGFGRALGASRCLIVRTDGPAAPIVTHEYVEPDISPLGLGRTGQFPPVAVSLFKHKVCAVPDLSTLEKSEELAAEEYEYFSDNGIRSMAGAPISSHGIVYGVIIILESRPGRKWVPHELDMLEIAANQTAVALSHSQAYLQLKDQLFNMNLLGNLTQQLTNTLELVSRSGKPDSAEDKVRQSGSSPPLSLRELEVLKLIAGGLANREIAQRLFLTESTVELHASRIRKKLKLKSRTALVKYACDNGLA
jgi:GAF domain-containing protein/DNA-binding CsgD family transcriptional regulator